MKIADFFIQITAKGDLKELKMIADAQKAIKEQSKMAIAAAKVKVAELKKETEAIKVQAKLEAEKVKITKQEPLIKAKTLNEELKAKAKSMQIAKAEAKEEAKKPKSIKEAITAALGLNKAFVAIAGSVILTAVALDKMVTKLVQANQLYTNFQRQTGMSMGRAIGMAGAMANLDVNMTPQEIMQNMQNFQNSLIGIQFGMGNIAPFQMAGINPFGTNAADMIEVLRKQLKQFAPEYRTFLLQQMGLDPRLGALIDLSDEEYLKQKQEALELYLSPADRKTIQELAPEWNKINLKFVKGWDKFVMILSRDFVGLGDILSDLWIALIDVLNVINTVLKPIFDLLTLILRPLYLLLDDLIGFLIGKDSIIGRWLKGDKEGTKGALGVLFGEGTKELERFIQSVKDFNDFLENAPLGKIIKFGLTGNTPVKQNWTDRMSDFLTKHNIINNTKQNKNLSMNSVFHINVDKARDGYDIVNAIRPYYNNEVAQIVQGAY